MSKATTAALAIVVASAIVVAAFQAPSADTKAAQASADSWLSLIDAQSYGKSWDEAGSGFKARVPREKWEALVASVRAPLGPMKSRTLKNATPASTLPGAPDGEYVVLQFDTTFVNKAAAVETVTTMRDTDGSWRVVGYFIK
jgi:hypothetical protein